MTSDIWCPCWLHLFLTISNAFWKLPTAVYGPHPGAEAMGFSHLSLAVTFSKCELFRDVIAPWCVENCSPPAMEWYTMVYWRYCLHQESEMKKALMKQPRSRVLYENWMNYVGYLDLNTSSWQFWRDGNSFGPCPNSLGCSPFSWSSAHAVLRRWLGSRSPRRWWKPNIPKKGRCFLKHPTMFIYFLYQWVVKAVNWLGLLVEGLFKT